MHYAGKTIIEAAAECANDPAGGSEESGDGYKAGTNIGEAKFADYGITFGTFHMENYFSGKRRFADLPDTGQEKPAARSVKKKPFAQPV